MRTLVFTNIVFLHVLHCPGSVSLGLGIRDLRWFRHFGTSTSASSCIKILVLIGAILSLWLRNMSFFFMVISGI